MDLSLIIGFLGVIGIGLYAFKRVTRTSVGVQADNKIQVEGKKQVKAIEDAATKRRQAVQKDLADSRGKDPSDVIGDLIDRGDISK